MVKKFKDFLIKRGLYNQFIENMDYYTFEELEQLNIPPHIYPSLFIWSDSIQGHEFWRDIANQWRDILNDKSSQK